MKKILITLSLAAMALLLGAGCGFTCKDLQNAVDESNAAGKAFQKAITDRNKAEAIKQKDILLKLCEANVNIAPLKCKLKGDNEEREYKPKTAKECESAKQQLEALINQLP
jgi:outer membrane lipopolysaccharide assembly protein LptE/RlpB